MSEQKILENNKLIARFMGYTDTSDEFKIKWLDVQDMERVNKAGRKYIPILIKNKGLVSEQILFEDSMQYHSSWNWLMLVIGKIQKLYDSKDKFGALIDITTTHIEIICKDFHYVDDKIENNWIPFDIERVYKAVIEFIKWYNSNK
jgi:hypothetical protein